MPRAAVAPAADPVSQGLEAVLGAHSGALTTAVDHSGALRAHGGAVLAQTAASLRAADEANATVLAAVAGGTAPVAAAPALPVAPPAPPAVMLPEIPALAPPPMLPGDQFSALIHGGPGSSGLRDFADAWRAHAATLDDLADQVLYRGTAIDEHWIDGQQRAGANTIEHGYWLRDGADKARMIAAAATDVADEFDTARSATPSLEEFDAARREFMAAQARRDPVGAAMAAREHADLQAKAVDAATNYHGGVTEATNRLGTPLQTAPAIARGGPSGVQAVDYKQTPPPSPPPYPINDVIAEATDLDGNHVVLRRGYYDAKTGKGFGWDKAYWRHGVVNPNVFKDLISHSRPVSNQGGTLVYDVPIDRVHCTQGFLGFADCENTGESVTMRIVANVNAGNPDVPDGGQKGVMTMYPLPGGSGVVELGPDWTWTPPWVNNNVPIN